MLDIADIENRSLSIAKSLHSGHPFDSIVRHDVPALIARIRELERANADMQDAVNRIVHILDTVDLR